MEYAKQCCTSYVIFLCRLLLLVICTHASIICPNVFIEAGDTYTITCNSDVALVDFYWYRGRTSGSTPILILESGQKAGSEEGSDHFDVLPDGSMLIKNATIEQESYYTLVGYYDSENFHSDTFLVNITISPDPPCPIIEGCNPCTNCTISSAFQKGSLTCKISGARPMISLSWKLPSVSGVSFIERPSIEQRNKSTDSWNTYLSLDYEIYESCGVEVTMQCEAQDSANITSSSTAELKIANEPCSDVTPNEDGFPILLVVLIILGAIAVIVTCIVIICLLKFSHGETATGESFLPLLPSKGTKINRESLVDALATFYEKYCALKPLPWGEPIPIAALYSEFQCEVTLVESSMSGLENQDPLEKITCSVDLFASSRFKDSSRVFFIADLGYGKTTMTQQVVHRWIKEEKTKFILIYVQLKDVDINKSIVAVVKDMLPDSMNVTLENIENVLKENKSLVLMDGLDELSMSLEEDTSHKDLKEGEFEMVEIENGKEKQHHVEYASSKAPVGDLVGSLKENTSDKVEDTSAKVEDTSDKVEDTGDKVEDTSDKVEDTGDKVEDTSDKVEDTSDTVEDTSDKVEDTSDKVGDTGDRVEDTSDKVEDTSDKFEDTCDKVEDTSDKVEDTSDKVEDTSDKVEDTSDKVEDTGDKVEDTSDKVEDTSDKVADTSDKVEDTGDKVEDTSDKVEDTCDKVEDTSDKVEDTGDLLMVLIDNGEEEEKPHHVECASSKTTVGDLLKGNVRSKDFKMKAWVTSREVDDMKSPFPPPHVKIKMTGFSYSQVDDYIRKTCQYYCKLSVYKRNPEEKEELFENAVDEVRKSLEKNDIIKEFSKTPLLLVLIIHILTANVTGAVTYLKDLKLTKLTTLIRTVITCLESRYVQKIEDESIQSKIEEIERKLGEVAWKEKLQVTHYNRDGWDKLLGTENVEMALSIGLLRLSKNVSNSNVQLRQLAFTSFTGVEFYHQYFQEYLAGQYFPNDKKALKDLETLIGDGKDDKTIRFLQFMSGCGNPSVESVQKIFLENKKMWNNFVDFIYEAEDQETVKSCIKGMSKVNWTDLSLRHLELSKIFATAPIVNFKYLDKKYHQDAVVSFCGNCNLFDIKIRSFTFRNDCPLDFLTKLVLPQLGRLEFVERDISAEDFVSIIEWLSRQRLPNVLQFTKCTLEELTNESKKTIKNAMKDKKLNIYRIETYSQKGLTVDSFNTDKGAWGWKLLPANQ